MCESCVNLHVPCFHGAKVTEYRLINHICLCTQTMTMFTPKTSFLSGEEKRGKKNTQNQQKKKTTKHNRFFVKKADRWHIHTLHCRTVPPRGFQHRVTNKH